MESLRRRLRSVGDTAELVYAQCWCYNQHQITGADLEALMRANVKFSEDVVPLGDMKINPGKIVRRIEETGRPVLLTSHGHGVAVIQGLSAFEAAQEECDFMRAVVAGLADVEAGRVVALDDIKRRLGL